LFILFSSVPIPNIAPRVPLPAYDLLNESKSNMRLLKLYDFGLPGWAIWLPSYGIWSRPWMQRVTWLLLCCLLYDTLTPYIAAFLSPACLHSQNESKSNVRLLKLYESGLPGWAIWLPSYGLWYRPWMQLLTQLQFSPLRCLLFVQHTAILH
jgi:hypothetical protein